MIHITCNMGSRDLPDMYALSPRASAIHIRQIPPAHVTTYTNVYVYTAYDGLYVLLTALLFGELFKVF